MELLRFCYKQPYIAYDVETGGLELCSLEIQRPWQLGVVKSIGSKIISQEEHWLDFPSTIDIMKQWGRDAIAVNHWTEEEFKNRAVEPRNVVRSFILDLYNPDNLIVTANGCNIDNYMIRMMARLLGGDISYRKFHNRHIDIQCIEKIIHYKLQFPVIGTNEWAALMLRMSTTFERGLKTSLSYLCQKYKIEYDADRHHKDGSYDALLTLQVFLQQINTYNLYI